MVKRNCRACGSELNKTFVNLGMSPLSNSYVKDEDLSKMEPFYPLHAFVCDKCFLVQLEEFQSPSQIFSDYAYFSSYSQSWLEHSKNYVEMMTSRFAFDSNSFITEIASNDGYLLQYFVEKGIPVLGVEPAENVAKTAIENGIRSEVVFWGEKSARELGQKYPKANLILGNNVLAHVPDINDFVKGISLFLANDGIVTIEFPHLLQLIAQSQFDTIYHEHFSYLALVSVDKIFENHDLKLFDVEKLPTHGGSLRIFAQKSTGKRQETQRLRDLRIEEKEFGLSNLDMYSNFSNKVESVKLNLLEFFIKAKKDGKVVAGYGAPAKGNTLLNYCGIGVELLPYTVDMSPHKQNKYLPGTHIPIYKPEAIYEKKPDYILILPWNLKSEIMSQMESVKEWGCKFVIAIPEIEILG